MDWAPFARCHDSSPDSNPPFLTKLPVKVPVAAVSACSGFAGGMEVGSSVAVGGGVDVSVGGVVAVGRMVGDRVAVTVAVDVGRGVGTEVGIRVEVADGSIVAISLVVATTIAEGTDVGSNAAAISAGSPSRGACCVRSVKAPIATAAAARSESRPVTKSDVARRDLRFRLVVWAGRLMRRNGCVSASANAVRNGIGLAGRSVRRVRDAGDRGLGTSIRALQ